MAEFGKWTSVEEELPKENCLCVVFGTYYIALNLLDAIDYYDSISIAYYDTNYGWTDTDCDDIKYWMKAPERPNEGGDV